jgi:uncharacterized phage-associated protein
MSFLIDKPGIKAVALYILKQTGHLGLHTLSKIMYFAQMKHLTLYGRPIADENFVAMQDGPVPFTLYTAVRKNHKRGIQSAFNIEGHMIEALEDPDMDELSVSDIKCLDESIKENAKLSFKALRIKSHKYAYTIAKNKEIGKNCNPIEIIDIATEGGADDGMLEYIQKTQEIDRQLAHGAF